MAVGKVAARNVVSFMMLNRCNKLYHSSRVKLPSVRMSASWFLDVYVLDVDFWIQVDSVK